MEHLTFKKEPHAYYWHEQKVPLAVTQVLGGLVLSEGRYVNTHTGKAIPQGVIEDAGKDGNLVHEACAGILQGRELEMNWRALSGRLVNPVKQFIAWRGQADIKEVLETEYQMYSERWQVAGTFDLLYRDRKGKLHMVDYKTSKYYKTAVAQVAAYASMYKEITKYRGKIYIHVLYLPKKEGKWKYIPYSQEEEIAALGYFLNRKGAWIWEKENL